MGSLDYNLRLVLKEVRCDIG